METFVLRWTKDNLPFWQGVDDGEKIEINAVADVINENAVLSELLSSLVDVELERDNLLDRIAELKRELMSLKAAYYRANNRGWKLEAENEALRFGIAVVRDSIDDRTHGAMLSECESWYSTLDALLKGE